MTQTAISLGSFNLFGGPPGLGIPLPFGGRVGFGERRAGTPFEAGPPGILGDNVRVVGRQRGFLVLDRGDRLFFFKLERRRRRPGFRGARKNQFDRLIEIALIKGLLK